MSSYDSPIPLSEIESVLAWVDSFKLSRPTKKINRDFSDAVLLAEILSVHYPKLVEMHNYPPRNSHALKLNNWMTLNRKVLKKLKLNLCCNTMEQLANCSSGVIERVLVMVRDKIRRDEELNKSLKDTEQNMSSGGSYYEACGEDENILVVPVKSRVNGVLETIQQKVVNYDSYCALKEELKDAKDSSELLKQKVEHLDSLLKLKEERIEELQKQLDRKQSRRKETAEAIQNTLQVPFENVPSPTAPTIHDIAPIINVASKTSSKSVEIKLQKEESKIPVKFDSSVKSIVISKPSLTEVSDFKESSINIGPGNPSFTIIDNVGDKSSKINAIPNDTDIKAKFTDVIQIHEDDSLDLDRIKSDVFKEIEIVDDKTMQDFEEFKDSEPNLVINIEESIKKEIKDIINPMDYIQNGY